jgi:hypothetical protein
VRSAGRIRSEQEFRIVQAYMDSLPPNDYENTSHHIRCARVRPNTPLQQTNAPTII